MPSLELQRIVTADGKIYDMPTDKVRYVLSTANGMGLPPLDYATTRFYKQDGVTEIAYFLEPRNFSLTIGSLNNQRADVFQARQDLLNAIRPNRNGQLTYIFRYQGGSIEYAIQARALSAPLSGFSPDEYNEMRYQGALEFIAHDPTWYNYATDALAGTPSTITELQFPITFDANNIWFGSGSLWGEFSISYVGTWYSYPLITAHGQFNTLTLYHQQLDLFIEWLGYIGPTETLYIDLRNQYDPQGNPTGVQIYDSNGANRFNQLSPVSDLLNFRIEPDGIVPDGLNTIDISALTQDANTDFSLTFNTRYIGI